MFVYLYFSLHRNSWEMIFSKSSDVISSTEMSCSRRIVQLCRDCLLIVYQFAAEAKGQTAPTVAMGDGSAQRSASCCHFNIEFHKSVVILTNKVEVWTRFFIMSFP